MADFARIIKRNPKPHFGTVYHDLFDKKDPNEFMYSGSQMFHGMQGEGKTASMYKYAMDLYNKNPNAVIVSNLPLVNFERVNFRDVENINNLDSYEPGYWRNKYIHYDTHDELMIVLKQARNGIYGVIFLIDEIHTYFHSHDSAKIPMWVQQVFSQQRKQHLVILGTVQDWNDLIKMIRTQAKNLVLCHRIGYFITQTVVDPRTMETEYGEQFFPVKKKGFFFLSKQIRDGYDTYYVIDSNRSVMGGTELNSPAPKNKNGTIVHRTSRISVRRNPVKS